MVRYLLRRLVNYLVMLVVATTGVFFLAEWRFNPINIQYPPERRAGIDDRAWATILRGFTERGHNPGVPALTRFREWASDVVFHWDWGLTVRGAMINEQVSARILVSVRLVLIGFLVGALIGILLGAWTATRQYKASDNAFTVWSLITLSTPVVVLAVTVQILAIKFNRGTGWNWFEFVGETGRHSGTWISPFLDRLQHLLLPTLVLALGQIAVFSRYQRSLMLDTLNADFVRTARAKGLRRRKAVFKHALRTAMIPTATLFAFAIAGVFTGAVFTERLFTWQGMGQYLITALTEQDLPSTVAIAAFSGVCVVIGAILSELVVVALDPRVRVA